MGELKATPGPWHLTGRDDGPGAYYMHIGAPTSMMVLAHMNECHTQSRPNAHLIAAAPELYDILRRISSPFGREDASDEEINAVLTKARGES